MFYHSQLSCPQLFCIVDSLLCHLWFVVCRFWLAVQELKKRPIREVPTRVQEIWQEFLAPGAPSAINVDSKSYAKTTQNVKDPGRYAFEDAQVQMIQTALKHSWAQLPTGTLLVIRSRVVQLIQQQHLQLMTHGCILAVNGLLSFIISL